VPIWLFATIVYSGLASVMGAKTVYVQASEEEAKETARKAQEQEYLQTAQHSSSVTHKIKFPMFAQLAQTFSWGCLVACLVMGIMAFVNQDIENIRTWLIVPTLIYFVTATYAYLVKEKLIEATVVDVEEGNVSAREIA
jgi:cytosine permease